MKPFKPNHGRSIGLSKASVSTESGRLLVREAAKLVLIALLSGAIVPTVEAQVSFTRIMQGDLAQDRGFFGGCAWGDYDNDGYPDLFVTDSGSTNRLYHNDGNGSFTRLRTGKIVSERSGSSGPAWADYDNDGDLDLFVASYTPPRDCFYRNDGNGLGFTKVTAGAWVTDQGAGAGAAWADYDNDGFLDLYVPNSWNQNNFLYRNNGDGTMTQITRGAPVTSDGSSHGCAWSDYDGDGDMDLFVVNGDGENDQQFLNNGDGSFTRVATGHLIRSGGDGAAVSCADYDNDGDLDLLVTGRGYNANRLYLNNGSVEPTFAGGLDAVSANSDNGAWGDYDNDGYLDLFIANNYGEDNFLYHNGGDGKLARVTEGALVHDGGRSCGCAWADYDNDGDLDLFVANGVDYLGVAPHPESGFLYRNDGGTNRWLILRLVGTASNRSAIGAKVRVLATIGGKSFWQLREISGGGGYSSQNDLRAHFGLGDAQTADTIRIEWPSGIVQEWHNVAARQSLTITEQQIGPTSPPRLSVTSVNNALLMTLTGQTNRLYVFEASTNLVRWTKLAVRTNLTGSVEWTDTNSTAKFPMRYFRALVP